MARGAADRPARSRLDDVEARLARLESDAGEVPTLKRGIVALARAHKAEAERIDALPAAVEGLVAQHVRRFVEEHLDALDALDEEESSLPDDVECVYKEIDQLAELVNKRDAVVDASLERIESLERSVGRLRRNVERAIRQLIETQAGATDTAPRLERSPTVTPAEAGPGPGGATAKPAFTTLDSLGDGLAGVDGALERARRRRDLSRRLD